MVEAIPLTIIGLFTLTLIFGFVRQYLLWRRREAFINQRRIAGDAAPPDEAWLEVQMAPYARKLTVQLIALIYLLPVMFLLGMILFLTRG